MFGVTQPSLLYKRYLLHLKVKAAKVKQEQPDATATAAGAADLAEEKEIGNGREGESRPPSATDAASAAMEPESKEGSSVKWEIKEEQPEVRSITSL